MSVRVAINGFGRVGRYLIRAAYTSEMDIVAVNSRAKANILAHILKYDSVHGKAQMDIATDGQNLIVGGKKIIVTNTTGILSDLPWKDLVLISSSSRQENSEKERKLSDI